MMDVEQRLRREFRARTAGPPHLENLADRAIAGAAVVRRRRVLMVTSAVAVVAVVALTVGLLRTSQPGPPAPASVPEALASLPVGPPPKLALYGRYSVRLPNGPQVQPDLDGAETIRHAEQAQGGWLVVTSGGPNGDALRVVRDVDGETAFAMTRVASFALSPDRVWVAVHTREQQNLLHVFDLLAGRMVAVTPLPTEPRGGPVVSGWTGRLVILMGSTPEEYRATDEYPNGTTTDVWNPLTGPYHPKPFGQRAMFGAAARPGDLLGLVPGGAKPEACLARLDFVTEHTETGRWCDAGLRFGETVPWVSPDGTRLVVWHHQLAEELVAVDLSTSPTASLRTTLPLPRGLYPFGVWWEDAKTVLLRVNLIGEPPAWDRMDLVRCRLDGSGCERARVPQVDGADPIGVAPS